MASYTNPSSAPSLAIKGTVDCRPVRRYGSVSRQVYVALLGDADAAYAAKYIDRESGKGFHIIPEAGNDSGVYLLRPRVALGWLEREFVRSPTRWRFQQA